MSGGKPYGATEAIAALIDGVSNLPGVTLDARDGMGVALHTTAQIKDWLTEELFIAQKREKGSQPSPELPPDPSASAASRADQ